MNPTPNPTPNPGENTGSSDSAPKQRGRNAEIERIRKHLTVTLAAVSRGIGFINVDDGQVIWDGTPDLVDAIIEVAKADKRVMLLLKESMIGGAYTQLLIAVLAIVIPVLANHGLIPPLFAFTAQAAAHASNPHNHMGGIQ